MKKVILASRSPNRARILAQSGIPFRVVESRYEEDMKLPLPPKELVKHLAQGKAREVKQRYKKEIVVAADTIIALGRKVFGKPGNAQKTRATLRAFSGRSHSILTGYVIIDAKGKERSGVVETRVSFRKLSPPEVVEYGRSREGFEKAGAYDLWGAGAGFIKSIEGDLLSAIGLPQEAVRILRRLK